MKNRTRMMRQDATYWAPPSRDGLGNKTFPAPVPLKVRWQQKRELITDGQGRQQVARAVVYVSQPVEVEGYLYLGESEASDPREQGAWEIRQTGASPNLRATEVLNKAWL